MSDPSESRIRVASCSHSSSQKSDGGCRTSGFSTDIDLCRIRQRIKHCGIFCSRSEKCILASDITVSINFELYVDVPDAIPHNRINSKKSTNINITSDRLSDLVKRNVTGRSTSRNACRYARQKRMEKILVRGWSMAMT